MCREKLLDVFADVSCVVSDALVVVAIEFFALYNPECLEVLLVESVLDLLPVDIGFWSADGALYIEALLALGAVVSCFEAGEDLLKDIKTAIK